MVPMALLVGAKADSWGRKPLFLGGLVILPIRGVLYTLSNDPYWLVAVQLLDGVGAGIYGAIFPIIVADLMRGTGRFNLAQGAVITAQGIGAALSTTVAGFVVVGADTAPPFDVGRGGGGRAVAILVFHAGDEGRKCGPRRSPRVLSASSRATRACRTMMRARPSARVDELLLLRGLGGHRSCGRAHRYPPARPSRLQQFVRFLGPFAAGLVALQAVGAAFFQASRNGCTAFQPASTLSARWNRMLSPIMQS